MAKRSFYDYFKESMASVGLPAPESVFGTVATATATINALLAAISSVGANATVTELLTVAEAGVAGGTAIAVAQGALVGVAGLSASYYVGACVGALIYASEMVVVDKLSSSPRIKTSNLFEKARRCNLDIPPDAYSKTNLALAEAMQQRRRSVATRKVA